MDVASTKACHHSRLLVVMGALLTRFLWSSSLVSLVYPSSSFLTVEATTVVIERDALGSSVMNDSSFAETEDDGSDDDDDGGYYCEYAGEIVLGQPMSVNRKDHYYVFGSQMHTSASMSVDQINQWPNCGVSLLPQEGADANYGAVQKLNYSLRLVTYGDESSTTKTVEIGRKIATDNRTDFMLAGYSSKLSNFIAPVAQENGRILFTAASSKTSIHADRDHVFGILAPSASYLENALKGTKAAGARTLAFVAQQDINFVCKGAAKMAEKYRMTLLEGLVLPDVPPLEDFIDIAQNMSALNPDVMITCIRSGVKDWNQAMRTVDWTPKAQVYMVVFGTTEFEQDLGTDLAYTMGVTSWDPTVMPEVPDGATQWTPADFYQAYQETVFRPPVYQIVAQSAAVSVLVQALNRVGRYYNDTDQLTELVQKELSTGSFPTVYGNVSFDENGQSRVPYMLLQYDDNQTLHVISPSDMVSTDFELVYPMPTWANRDCNVKSACITTNGTCTVNGTCSCPSHMTSYGAGPSALCIPPPEESEDEDGDMLAALIGITVPLVVVTILAGVGTALFVYYQKKQQENNAVWQVQKEELLFADPPEVIGRGTFGLVLLAEYRGTQVAVKRVLPPKQKQKHKTATTNTAVPSDSSFSAYDATTTAHDDNNTEREHAGPQQQHHHHHRQQQHHHHHPHDATTSSYGMISWTSWGMASATNSISGGGCGGGDSSGYHYYSNDGASSSNNSPRHARKASVASSSASTGMQSSSNNTLGIVSGSLSSSCVLGGGDNSMISSRIGGEGGRRWRKNKGQSIRFGLKSLAKKKANREAALHRKLKADFIEEMRYVSKLRHPNITTVMGAVLTQVDEPMLIMEYMDHGSLYGILHNDTMLLEGEVVLPLLRDISQGCRFLHSSIPQVIHGDLKAANILVDAKFRAKVADFGLSQKKQMVTGWQTTTSGSTTTTTPRATGSPFWMAPELLRGESPNTAESDVYAFGMILYEVFSRKDPYEDDADSVREILRQVKDPNVSKRPPVPDNCPSQMAALMSDCLVEDPFERPSFQEVDKRLKRVHAEAAKVATPAGRQQQRTTARNNNNNNNNSTGDDAAKSSSTTAAARAAVSLFDIFPKHVAEALRDGKQVEPEHRDRVTIFFCDIVGFTAIASALDPRKVANLLDRLYQAFDKLSREHDVFKVETIGDAYMAVTNLVKDQSEDHTKRIATFAACCVRAANDTLIDISDKHMGTVNIRAGMHVGPVVADVVGTRNPRYCLFGDSVNVASRMESNSRPNRIHCSETAAISLKKQYPDMPLKCRGMIEVKGKGEMKTYWVNEGPGAVHLPMIQEQAPPAASPAPPPPSPLDNNATTTSDETTESAESAAKEETEQLGGSATSFTNNTEEDPGVVVGRQARCKLRGIEATVRERFIGSEEMHPSAGRGDHSISTVYC